MGAVRFKKPWSLYNPGETAGFDEETTAMLIAAEIAVPAEPAEAEKPAAKRAKKTPVTDVAEPAGEGAVADTTPAD